MGLIDHDLSHDLNSDSLKFLYSLKSMFKSTIQLMFLPRGLTHWTSTQLWKEHFKAWDIISEHGEGH